MKADSENEVNKKEKELYSSYPVSLLQSYSDLPGVGVVTICKAQSIRRHHEMKLGSFKVPLLAPDRVPKVNYCLQLNRK